MLSDAAPIIVVFLLFSLYIFFFRLKFVPKDNKPVLKSLSRY